MEHVLFEKAPDSHTGFREWPPRPSCDGPVIYPELSDAALLARISQSDRQALEALYDRYGRRVFALAARVLNDPEASEEVTQDVFLSVWRRVDSYRPGKGKFTTWLLTIAHNRTIDELRRRRRDLNRNSSDVGDHQNIHGDAPLPADQIVAESEYAMLRRAMANLPREQRRVVEMSYFGGLTQTEISEQTGQPLGTVKTRMRLALKKLREWLKDRLAAPER